MENGDITTLPSPRSRVIFENRAAPNADTGFMVAAAVVVVAAAAVVVVPGGGGGVLSACRVRVPVVYVEQSKGQQR